MTDIFCIGMGDENFDKLWIAVMIIPVVVFSWIRNLDNLASMSILANIFTVISLVVIFYDEIYRFATNNAAVNKPENLKPFGDVEGVALFFGTVIFSFEGIGMVSSS
jgi:proton-coupled amino acid transporter